MFFLEDPSANCEANWLMALAFHGQIVKAWAVHTTVQVVIGFGCFRLLCPGVFM
jgi:hypothetical protein